MYGKAYILLHVLCQIYYVKELMFFFEVENQDSYHISEYEMYNSITITLFLYFKTRNYKTRFCQVSNDKD